MIVSLVLRLELAKSCQGLDLEKDPSLFGLVYNSLEEGSASLDQERVSLVLIFVAEDVDVLVDDLVVHEN